MIRRFLYHSFWNFYDYLGTSLLLGAAGAFSLLLVLLAGGGLASVVAGGAGRAVALLVMAAAFLLLLVWFIAGMFAFATRAARDEAARLPHFLEGTRTLFRPYLKLVALLAGGFVVLVSNITFYIHLRDSLASPGAAMVLTALSMLFVWLVIGLLLFGFCVLGVPARFPDDRGLRGYLRRGVMLLVLAPGLWIAALLMYLLCAAACFLSVVGVVFALPLLAVFCTTALDLVVRLVDDLGRAREELGAGRPISVYKRRALEFGWEWEYRQPRRTLRELIKPWET